MKRLLSFFLALFFFFHFNAQKTDSLTVNNNQLRFTSTQLIVPVSLMTAGVLTENRIKYQVADYRNKNLSDFHTKVDDVLQFSPQVAMYVFDIAGMKAKNDWKNQTAILVKGEIIALTSTVLLKKIINNTRPDGTKYSFPSGHTANAFAGAVILSEEFKDNYPWVPYIAYGTAGAVGVLRMANNRHYISDVLFGAGLGFLSMKLAYWTHQYQWNKKEVNKKDPFEGSYKK